MSYYGNLSFPAVNANHRHFNALYFCDETNAYNNKFGHHGLCKWVKFLKHINDNGPVSADEVRVAVNGFIAKDYDSCIFNSLRHSLLIATVRANGKAKYMVTPKGTALLKKIA